MMELLDQAPHLLPTNVNKSLNVTTYAGFIKISGKSYFMKLKVPKRLSDSHLECEWKLQQALQPKTHVIRERLKNAASLSSFLKDFVLIAQTCFQDECVDHNVFTEKCETVLQHIQEVSSGKLVYVDNTFSIVEFELCDRAERVHKIRIELNSQDISKPPVCITDLPQDFDFHWSTKCRLQHLMEQFEATVESYQDFWNVLKDMDDNCWILEPDAPSFSATHRRIALGPNVSLHVTVNCVQPRTLPECRFFGAESVTSPLKDRLNVNLHLWDIDRSLLNNLQEVLNMDFPSPMQTSSTELTVDCGICYCLHLDKELPDIVCEDKRCAQAFHRTCLYEWLRNLASRQSFDTIFGECPFCNHPIRVKKYD